MCLRGPTHLAPSVLLAVESLDDDLGGSEQLVDAMVLSPGRCQCIIAVRSEANGAAGGTSLEYGAGRIVVS